MSAPSPQPTLTDRVRTMFADIVRSAGRAVYRLGIHPDTITIAGLIVIAVASLVIAGGAFQVGGVLLVLSFPLDALDGAVARAMNRQDRRGAVLDSVLDRYADGLIFGGLIVFFAARGQTDGLILAVLSLIGSFVVSYVRARAGEAGLSVKIGWFSRLERAAALVIALLIPPLVLPMLWILAIGTNITAVQRLLYVYRHLDQ
jgi:CDP-diacylglycerol--glycerol-3-phosphate 3-phosphatidyltransferase